MRKKTKLSKYREFRRNLRRKASITVGERAFFYVSFALLWFSKLI